METPILSSKFRDAVLGMNCHCAECLLFLRNLLKYRSVLLVAKRDLESFDCSKISQAFLLREYCFNSLLFKAELRKNSLDSYCLCSC